MIYQAPQFGNTEVVQRVVQRIERHAMLSHGDKVLAAVSGGADSTALLYILHTLAPRYGIELGVAHLNHGLRGSAADADARFVRAMSSRLELPFHCSKIRLDPSRGSLEERGRQARYAFFARLALEHGYTRVALGHHMGDNAEAVLMHLLRGSGIKGLAGIPPVRDGRFIRPLMDLQHQEIVKYLNKNEIPFVEDDTNSDPRFHRNRIRHELIPMLQKLFNVNVVAALNRTADLCREEDTWFEHQLRPLLEETIESLNPDCLQLSVQPLSGSPLAVKRRLIRDGLRRWRGDLKRISADHIDAVIGLLPSTAVGKRLCLPNRIGAERCPRHLRFDLRRGRGVRKPPPAPSYSYRISVPQDRPREIEIPEAGLRLEFSIEANHNQMPDRWNDEDTAWFDADQLTFPLTIRTFNPGDRMTLLGMTGHRKIKKLIGERKIPLDQRHRIPLLISANTILWVVGVRRSGQAVLSDRTRRVLKVEKADTLKS